MLRYFFNSGGSAGSKHSVGNFSAE